MTDPTGTANPTAATPTTDATDTSDTATSPQRRPGALRRFAGAVAAVLAGTTLLALVAVLVLAGLQVRPPLVSTPVAPVEVVVPAAATDLVCPGPLRLATEGTGQDAAYDPQFDPTPVDQEVEVPFVGASVDGAAPSGEVTATTSAGGTLATLGRTTSAVADLVRPDAGVLLHGEPAEGLQAWVAGATVATTSDGDLRSLAAAGCQLAAAESWLVGGSTMLGSGARLVLTNPGRTPATVRLQLWGPTGPVEPAGATEYLVPAGQERVVLLEGVAAQVPRLVLHVVSSGGLVAAHLQDTELRGLVPAGADLVVAGVGPAPSQVVPGLSVTVTPADGADQAVLRLLAPEQDGTARVALLGPDGPVDLPGAAEVALAGGEVVDLPLGGLPAGSYTAVVTADVDLVAGAMLTRGQGVGAGDQAVAQALPLDRAWAPSRAPGRSGALALAPSVPAELVVSAVPIDGVTGRATATVQVVGRDGVLAVEELVLEAGSTQSIELAGVVGADEEVLGVVLRTDDPRIAWAAVLVSADPDGDLVAVLAPVPPRDQASALAVRPR